ncbi:MULTISPECIES: class I SAM-dependent methyltransferase [unclassified Sphingobium]|uniref:class I SAM-dependent methyltransferase n=1 Tax=unclassified Sphingobium TaxID=2611147 RepID=UPI002224340B|nr:MULTISPECIES: class I SAM-dependent methyltransferase [unclassified Sphingobium]MCW2395918.1 SAM-dependent methyltransferase [Sphingobium sp. B8D3B]MCW2419434.1 SAM-dependent methyltransferase [Sphingobium sp. B8D3C]
MAEGGGTCTGVDISPDLIRLARLRAEQRPNAHFLCGDAQRHDFPPEQFDAIVSRFGVMFFDDPVAAFVNIRRAARPGAALRCIVWRGMADNPFMATQYDALSHVSGPQAKLTSHAPGQFAFADDRRVKHTLAGAGWHRVTIEPVSVPCELPANDLAIYARRMGGMETILASLDEVQSLRLQRALDAGFARFVVEEVAWIDAGCWMVRATRE